VPFWAGLTAKTRIATIIETERERQEVYESSGVAQTVDLQKAGHL
jgi:hypothetical protein